MSPLTSYCSPLDRVKITAALNVSPAPSVSTRALGGKASEWTTTRSGPMASAPFSAQAQIRTALECSGSEGGISCTFLFLIRKRFVSPDQSLKNNSILLVHAHPRLAHRQTHTDIQNITHTLTHTQSPTHCFDCNRSSLSLTRHTVSTAERLDDVPCKCCCC